MFYMDAKKILWDNLLSLMVMRYGEENIYRLNKESGISKGTLARIKDQKTAVGLDLLEKLADFFHMQPWQMLIPELDPKNPPVFAITEAEKRFYAGLAAIKDLAKTIADTPQ